MSNCCPGPANELPKLQVPPRFVTVLTVMLEPVPPLDRVLLPCTWFSVPLMVSALLVPRFRPWFAVKLAF